MGTTTCHRPTEKWCCLILALSIGLFLSAKARSADEGAQTQHYKMLSSVEYTGKAQFGHQIDTFITVRKQALPDGKAKYFISSDNVNLASGGPESGQQPSPGGLSFIVDKKKAILAEGGGHLELLEKINNECMALLTVVSKENVGKTWKQSFHLPSTETLLPGGVTFTLTATPLETKVYGKLIGVRALSEPFFVKAANAKGGTGTVKAKINAAYLFDPEMNDVYLSLSVFQAQTTMNGFPEVLRHEVATYKTDAAGASVDLGGLGTKFGAFAKEVGLTSKSQKVKEEGPLPAWARSEGLIAAQVTNVCAATACEGAANPVALIYVPLGKVIAMQSAGMAPTAHAFGTVGHALATRVTGLTGVKIAVAPAAAGMGLGTAAAAGGAAAGGIAIAGSNDESHSDRSPSEP
jgi:hypothetical protein